MQRTPPFAKETQLYHKLEITVDGKRAGPASAGGPTGAATRRDYLPGEPRIGLYDNRISEYLQQEFMTSDLDKISPHLWLVAKQDSTHISSLTHQIVRGREIIVTEKPDLHLVWIYDRVFIKPIPKYLLSHDFWQFYLINKNRRLPVDQQQCIARAALGFIRSYAYLIRHKSDFLLATDDAHRLLPKNVTYSTFVNFIKGFEDVHDDAMSLRYKFGELRLSRLYFWSKILLRRFTYYRVHGQYGAYFARFYGPFLFIFAVFSVVLNAMQVALAATPSPEDGVWIAFAQVSRGFSIFTMICVSLVILFLLSTLFLLSSREIVYALKDLWKVGDGKAEERV